MQHHPLLFRNRLKSSHFTRKLKYNQVFTPLGDVQLSKVVSRIRSTSRGLALKSSPVPRLRLRLRRLMRQGLQYRKDALSRLWLFRSHRHFLTNLDAALKNTIRYVRT